MEHQCLRVLQVVGKMDRAGAETLLMNLYRHIDRDRVQFDFLTHRQKAGDYDAEILELGGRIYRLCAMSVPNALKYWQKMNLFWMEHSEYHIVHSHIDAMSALPLFGARKAGVPVRIAHSHNTAFPKDLGYPLRIGAKALLPNQCTHFFACSAAAARFLFPPKIVQSGSYITLRNAIELDRYIYNKFIREKKREEMGIGTDTLVIGHVGRFCKQKNHDRLIHIFARIHHKHPNSRLLLVGQGELLEKTKTCCERMKIREAVCFLGVRADVDQLMQAFDLFLLPSLYEGFPVVGVEAQAAGLPCLFSDNISVSVAMGNNIVFLSLKEDDVAWAEAALKLCQLSRADNIEIMREKGFDIRQQAAFMEKFYIEVAEQYTKTAGVVVRD